jgi:hypothetical protein
MRKRSISCVWSYNVPSLDPNRALITFYENRFSIHISRSPFFAFGFAFARSARRETDERRDSTQRRRVRTCSLTVGVGCRLRLVSLCHRVSCRVSILLNPVSATVCCASASCLRPPQYVAVCDRPRSSSSSSSRRACFGVARAHARSLARSLAPLSKRRRPRAPRCWWARRPSTRGQRQGRRRRERATRGSEWGRWRGSG